MVTWGLILVRLIATVCHGVHRSDASQPHTPPRGVRGGLAEPGRVSEQMRREQGRGQNVDFLLPIVEFVVTIRHKFHSGSERASAEPPEFFVFFFLAAFWEESAKQ